MVVAVSICFGLTPLFANLLSEAGIASSAIAFYRYVVSALVVLPFLALGREKRRETLAAMAAGLLMGVGWIGYIEALKVAPVAAAGVIYMSYPLFTLLFAWLLLKQRPAARMVLAGVMILFGAVISLSPAAVPAEALGALLLSFSAPLGFAIAITVVTGKLLLLTAVERMAGVMNGALIGLIPMIAGLDIAEILPESSNVWLLVAGVTLVTALVPQFIYSYAAPKIGPARAAMAGSFELPTMFLIGFTVFGERIGPWQLLAGALVVLAIVITPPRRVRSDASPQPANPQRRSPNQVPEPSAHEHDNR